MKKLRTTRCSGCHSSTSSVDLAKQVALCRQCRRLKEVFLCHVLCRCVLGDVGGAGSLLGGVVWPKPDAVGRALPSLLPGSDGGCDLRSCVWFRSCLPGGDPLLLSACAAAEQGSSGFAGSL